MTMIMSKMKTLAFGALLYAVTFASLHGTPGAQAETVNCDDAPGMEGCSSESTSSSSTAKPDKDTGPAILKLHKTLTFDEPTFIEVDEDLVLVSDDVIDTVNMHFVVHEGVTLTFKAPAVKVARDEVPPEPLFKLSGTVRFQPTGSTPALLDGSIEDEWGIVQTTGNGSVFLPDRDDIVRYHRSGMTVSRMEDTGGDLNGPRHEEVELSPELKASLEAIHAKIIADSNVPASTFSSSHSPASTFFSFLSSAKPEVVDNDGESDVCLLVPYYDTLDRPESCPNPAFSPSNTATTTPPMPSSSALEVGDNDGEDDVCLLTPYFDTLDQAGSCPNPAFNPAKNASAASHGADEAADHANAKADCNGNTSDRNNTKSHRDSKNDSHKKDQEHERGHGDGTSSNGGDKTDQTASTTAQPPPSPTTSHPKPSVSTPRRVLTVGDKLKGPLMSSTGMSAIWTEKHGSIVFGKIASTSPNASGEQKLGSVLSTILILSDAGRLNRVLRAREALSKEMREGSAPTDESRRVPWGWGWVPCRSQLHKDVERARGRMGEVEMTLTDRAGVEVSMDGTRVLSKSGRFSREWMNRFPWRWSRNMSYELHVKDDGIEVRLGERVLWGVTADDMMG